jgi:HSP20 family protein
LTIEGKILAAKEGGENNTSEGMSIFEILKLGYSNRLKAATGEISTQLATQISTERSAIGNFTRTVVLPRPVDSSNVAAKLEDGVLKVTLSKVEDKGSVTVRVD